MRGGFGSLFFGFIWAGAQVQGKGLKERGLWARTSGSEGERLSERLTLTTPPRYTAQNRYAPFRGSDREVLSRELIKVFFKKRCAN